VFINKNSEGKISIANSNPNAISTILTGNNLIVSGDGSTNGTALLTISVAEDDNYTAPASVTVEVTASYVKIVSWAEGSEEDIIAMLNAHYNGIIDVSDYWAEGDVKTVSLGAIASGTTDESQERQEIDLLIIGFNHDTLETPINDQTNSAITVQVKNCLNNIGYINKSYNILSCSLWSEAQRRTWCNSDFLEALPNYIISLIKPVTKVTNRGCHYDRAGYEDYRSQYTTTDKVFLLSDSEIFGSGNYLSKNASLYGELPSDGSQYKYMKTQSNRVKSIDKTDTSWWSRTGFINSYGYANYVSSNTTGSCVELYANKSVGLSPAFCL
jgi:hypothetical protein